MIEGCYKFLGQKLANTCSFVFGRIIVRQEKMLTLRRSWINPLNAFQEAIYYSFIKLCTYSFFHWYEFFVNYTLRVEKKNINMILMRDLWNFSFLGRGDVSPIHSELSLCFGVIGKTPSLNSRNNFVKNFCLHRPSP